MPVRTGAGLCVRATQPTPCVYALPVTVLDSLAVLGLAAGVLGLVVGVIAHVRLAKLRAKYTSLVRSAHIEGDRGHGGVSGVDPHAIRNVAVVRYDAFRDMGGRLSFSMALLDSTDGGVVLTSINGRTETRTYAKVIHEGTSAHALSPEEEQVVREASRGRGLVLERPDGEGAAGDAHESPTRA